MKDKSKQKRGPGRRSFTEEFQRDAVRLVEIEEWLYWGQPANSLGNIGASGSDLAKLKIAKLKIASFGATRGGDLILRSTWRVVTQK